jgi:hypothetical protein
LPEVASVRDIAGQLVGQPAGREVGEGTGHRRRAEIRRPPNGRAAPPGQAWPYSLVAIARTTPTIMSPNPAKIANNPLSSQLLGPGQGYQDEPGEHAGQSQLGQQGRDQSQPPCWLLGSLPGLRRQANHYQLSMSPRSRDVMDVDVVLLPEICQKLCYTQPHVASRPDPRQRLSAARLRG